MKRYELKVLEKDVYKEGGLREEEKEMYWNNDHDQKKNKDHERMIMIRRKERKDDIGSEEREGYENRRWKRNEK